MQPDAAARFDAETLRLLESTEEVTIETTRPDGSRWRTIIWVVVEGGDVFVRSVRGDRSHWYLAALDRPEDVQLLVEGRRISVRALDASDENAIRRCSRALSRKYRTDQSLPSMLRPMVLATTLRLEPR